MSIRILHPGAWATVQDLGRPGCGAIGASAGGAADTLALTVGNRLVGNGDGAAAIEMTLVGGRLAFEREALIACTGAPCPITLEHTDGRMVELATWRAFTVRAGERVRLGAMLRGARAYLCVAGGIDKPPVLGSRSMHVQSGLGTLGGACGRTLRAGDVLPIGAPLPGTGAPPVLHPDAASLLSAMSMRRTLRVTGGPHASLLGAEYLAEWFGPWRVSSRFDRTGLRLERMQHAAPEQANLPKPGAGSITTEGVMFGCVQVTATGEPIILGPDAPPTGGYLVAGTVCAADLPSVGQLRAGDVIQFEVVGKDFGRVFWHVQQEDIDKAIPPIARAIDLNSDVGESEDEASLARDVAMAGIVTSINIACGGHAGSDESMRVLMRAARDAGTQVGAHPGFPDRAHFGRASMEMPPGALEACVREQVTRLGHIAGALGVRLTHVKPHGALYHDASQREALARAIARACRAAAPGAALVAQAGSRACAWYAEEGVAVVGEAFADRAYEPSGALTPRGVRGALLTKADAAAVQAVMIARDGRVRTTAGTPAEVCASTLCVHSDTPGALPIARAVRSALERAGVQVRAPRTTTAV